MDVQKFMFAIEGANPQELRNHAENLLMDIKNCSASVTAWAAEIGAAYGNIATDKAKQEINIAMLAIESLVAQYKLLAEQRKAFLYRIKEVERLSVPQYS
jgi:hypothetical protein